MTVPNPFFFATALAVAFLAGCTETIAQGLNPEISVQLEFRYLQCVPPRPRLNDPMMYCADENLNDLRGNFTARCNARGGGIVVWLIGGYAIVDRDQFSPEVYGVLIEEYASNISHLSLFPCGADFLMGQFRETFNITCINVFNEVNIYRSSHHLFFHEGFPDIEQPEVTVVRCNMDGSYDVMLKYEKFDDVEVCAVARAEDLTYSLTLNDSDCNGVIIGSDDVTVLCRNVRDRTATATLEVCGGSFCKTADTPMTVSCNSATYGFCTNETSPTGYNIRFRANFPSSVDGDWGIALASSFSGGDIFVIDILDDVPVGDPQPAVYDPNLDCGPGLERDPEDITVGFSATLYTTSEDQGNVGISIIISEPSSGGAPRPFSLSFNTQDNTAVSPADYASVSSQVISFSTGDTSHTVTLSITNDDICEMTDESFSVSISLLSGTAPITISPQLAQVVISDSDEPECVPTLSFSSETYVAVEDEGSVEVCVVLNIPLAFALDFRVITTDTGSATAGKDFAVVQQIYFLSPGATERCITIGIVDDDTALEGNEVFSVELATAFFPVPIDVSTAEVTIIDADFASVGLEQTFYQVNESAGSVEVCAAVYPVSECPIAASFHILLATLDDTAVSSNDYTSVSASLPFTPCVGKECFSITIIDDSLPETTEFFDITLERPPDLSSRITVDVPGGSVLIIDNDDDLPCQAHGGVSEVTISCSSIGPETPLQCSFDGGPLHSCNVPMVLTNEVSPAGSYSVRIEAIPGVESTVSYNITESDSNVVASVPPLQVILTEGSPRAIGNSVEAEFVTSRPVTGARCFLRYQNHRDYKDCSSGSVSFTGLKAGRYILKVSAYNKQADVATVKTVVNIN